MATPRAGALHREVAGQSGPPLVLLHQLPHELSAWTYQLTHLSRWCRAVALDLPGHGSSPPAVTGLTLPEVAEACWAAVDAAAIDESVVLAGVSVGAVVAKYMVHARPAAVRALVLTGGGYQEGAKGIAARHVPHYETRGAAHRREHLFANFSEAFRATPLAAHHVDVAMARSPLGTEGTVAIMRALEPPDPSWLHAGLHVPTLVVAGGEDRSLPQQEELARRVAGAALRIVEGAGHSVQLERPWEYDGHVLDFLRRQSILP